MERGTRDGIHIRQSPPHVLMLTGIVVSAATTAVALAIVIRIYQLYGTIEESEIIEKGEGI